MDLERMAVRLRPRNAWEALDLGVALVRVHWRQVYAAWLALYLPLLGLAYLAFPERPFWAWIFLWWLKPLLDRAVLAVLAGALFGEPRPARAFFSAPGRAFLRTGLFAALTWRRFDLARSFHLPVHQLERSTGRAMRQRLRTMDRDSRGAAVWLTFMLANVEGLMILALSLAVALAVPLQTPVEVLVESWFRGRFVGEGEGALAGALLAALAVTLVEPFYVACGFTLYLQRRTHLEGWDIELRFRQLAARLASGAAAVLLAVLAGAMLPAGDALAAPEAARDTPARREIKAVLADPVFGQHEPVRRLEYVGPTFESGESKASSWDWSWLKKLAALSAAAVRVVMWIAGAILLAVLLYYVAKFVRRRGLPARRGPRPDFLFGFDVRPESLPDDVAAAAEALAGQGRLRAALSLLYRGALVRFLDEGVEFLQGDTEGDCLRRVRAAATPRRRDYFLRLVLAWQNHAYAHRAIATPDLLALAGQWRAHFDGARP